MNRETIIRSLFDNMHAIKRSVGAHLFNQDCPLRPAQVELLFTIRHLEPISFKRLAQELYMTPGAVSQMGEALEEHGYIDRETDPQDRRVQWLRLSRKGGKLLRDVEKRREHLMNRVMEGLSDEDLAVWLKVQERMLHHLQTELTTHNPKETK